MESKDELHKIQENYESVKHNIAQQNYYLDTKKSVLHWLKHYSEHNDNGKFLYDLLRQLMTTQKMSRLQAYALTGLISDLIYDADGMNNDIDSTLDSIYSGINGECIREQVFNFPDDPHGEDHQQYAWGNKWKLWQEK